MYWGPRIILYCFGLFSKKEAEPPVFQKTINIQGPVYHSFFFFCPHKIFPNNCVQKKCFLLWSHDAFQRPGCLCLHRSLPTHIDTHIPLHTHAHVNLCKTIFCGWYKDEYNLKWIVFLYSSNFKRNETFWGVSKVSWTLGEWPFMLNWLFNSPLC